MLRVEGKMKIKGFEDFEDIDVLKKVFTNRLTG